VRGGGACELKESEQEGEHYERKGWGAGVTSIVRLKLRQRGGVSRSCVDEIYPMKMQHRSFLLFKQVPSVFF